MDLSCYDLSLYHMHPTRSVRALWACYELGMEVEVIHIDLMKGEHFRPEFKALNPMKGLPTLVLTERKSGQRTVMTESGAIVTFLAEAAGKLSDGKDDVVQRAAYHRWCTFATAAMDPPLWTIRVHEQLLGPGMAIPDAAAMARKEFADKVVPTLAEAVGTEGNWVVGGEFSAADILVGYAVMWADIYKLADNEQLRKYLDRCKKRDAFRRAMKNDLYPKVPTSAL